MCKDQNESVYHLVCSCPIFAPTSYLKVRHNQITKILYQEIIKSDHLILNPPEVTVKDGIEVWYDMEVQTTPNIGEIHYHKGKQNKCSKQIEFSAESNQFEKESKVEINEMYSNC